MTDLAAHYPHIARALAPFVEGWAGLSPDERNAWIVAALDNVSDNRDDIEVPARLSTTGNPVVVDLTEPMLSTIKDAAAAARNAQSNLERLVHETMRSPISVTAIAEAAGVTRQTAYRWANDD